jgi:hypothetical protein
MKTLGNPPPGIQVSGSRCAVRRQMCGSRTVLSLLRPPTIGRSGDVAKLVLFAYLDHGPGEVIEVQRDGVAQF